MGSGVLGRLITRAVSLTAVCGLALSFAGSMAVHRQQYFNAWTCGEQVWDINLAGSNGVWATAEKALAGRELTLLASGSDPALRHVSGTNAECLTGADEHLLASLRGSSGLLLRAGSALAARATVDGVVQGRPALVIPAAQWPGPPHDSAIQPTPAFDDSPSYVGFLVGKPEDMTAAVGQMRTAGLDVTATPAADPTRAALAAPVLGLTSLLTALTAGSVTAYWALSLRSGEKPQIRVLRLLGVSPVRAGLSRWRVSLVPFLGAALVAAALWAWVERMGGFAALSSEASAVLITAVVGLDAAWATATHMAALWVKRVPR